MSLWDTLSDWANAPYAERAAADRAAQLAAMPAGGAMAHDDKSAGIRAALGAAGGTSGAVATTGPGLPDIGERIPTVDELRTLIDAGTAPAVAGAAGVGLAATAVIVVVLVLAAIYFTAPIMSALRG